MSSKYNQPGVPGGPDASGSRSPATHKRRKRRRMVRRLLRLTTAFLVLCLILAGAAYGYILYRGSQIHHITVSHLVKPAPSGVENILMIGNNSRCALNGKQSTAFGSCSQVGGARSDVTMLLHLDPAKHTASILSIPRDLFLPIPGTANENRIDDSLNPTHPNQLSNPSQLVDTIESDLGIPINHFVMLNFDTFQNVVDVLGGVNMYFPNPVKDAYSGLNITAAGCHHLNGTQALALVRARHMYYYQNGSWQYDPTGDIGRITRDHQFLRVLAAAVARQGLSNPLKDNALVGSVLPSLTVDQGFGLQQMASLALTYHGINAYDVPTNTLPVINHYYSGYQGYIYRGGNYGDILMPYQPTDQQAIDAFLGRSDPPGSSVSPQSVKVAVLNGTGTSGQASTTSSQLQGIGYNIVGTGSSAPVANFSETVVYYKSGEISAAQSVMSHLSGVVTMGQGPTADGSDVTVVTGSKFSVTGTLPASGSTSSTTGTQSNTTSSSAPSAPSGSGPSHNYNPVPGLSSNYSLIQSSHAIPSYDPRACPAGARLTPG
ncbi:MAG: LCP family protein [Actinobacteria bacterium]|nr:LCP family protein [Actinomycetota bacterium]MCL5446460.1 LCP family protein [Actinomycetota bacterium]